MNKKYTEDEYREVLMAILDMNAEERKEVFGDCNTIQGYIVTFSPSELIEKYRAFTVFPKTGECWKRKSDYKNKVVIHSVPGRLVYYYHCDNGTSDLESIEYFIENFTKTKYHSEYIEAFLNEMKKLDEAEESEENV